MPIRALCPALLAAGAAACLIAGAAQAQVAPANAPGQAEGLRYLSWSGRTNGHTPADVSAAQARAHNGMIPRRIAPSQAVNQPHMQAPQPVRTASNGLTPASAWLTPQPIPSYAPNSPDPMGYTRQLMSAPVAASPTAVDPQPRYEAPVQPQSIQAQPRMQPSLQPQAQYLPNQGAPVRQMAPAPAPVQTAANASFDPMAPRADAPVFRLNRPGAMAELAPQPQGAVTEDAPSQAAPRSYAQAAPINASGQAGARRYSVHREAGEEPDPIALPAPVYFDSVDLTQPPGSDLSQPPETQAAQRDAQGRRIAPARDDDPERP